MNNTPCPICSAVPNQPAPCSCDSTNGRTGCTNPPTELHTCPYQEDINGDTETLCTCCADCQGNCSDEI